MAFVKVQKSKQYFKRFQVKYRRRRDGKTDYVMRRALVIQDKNKFGLPKFRLVVRMTSRYVIAQVISAEIKGDNVLAAAISSELPQFGVKVGLKNYTSAYMTGYLVARRALAKVGLTDTYTGLEEPDGVIHKIAKGTAVGDNKTKKDHWVPEVDAERNPFRAYLDVGLARTTTGARIFAVMKGAVDGGMDIPHNEKRFPGYIKEAKKYDADELRNRITGGHIKDYMEYLEEEDVETFEKRFAGFTEAGVTAENIEEMYAGALAKIRENPNPAKPKSNFNLAKSKAFRKESKKTLAQRKESVAEKKAARAAKLRAALAAADEDDE